MVSISHHDITVILLAAGLLLLMARLLGEVFTRFNQPAVIGEILAGILLGPTVLGALAPSVSHYLFPGSGASGTVLSGLTTLAVVLFLLVAGMEVDLSAVFRQGKAALTVSLAGIVVPFGMGLAAGWFLPGVVGAQPDVDPLLFALFFATALSISALPVIAKTLLDLNLYRSDLGMIVIAAAVCDDLFGWLTFAVILAMMGVSGGHGLGVQWTIIFTLAYATAMLTLGRWLIDRSLPWLQAKTTWPGGVLSACLAGALFSAAITEWIGVHAIFGAFLFGVAIGDSPHLRQRTRTTIEQFVSFIFAPLFFGSIGLRVNFAQHFDLQLTLVVLVIACLCKVLGCGLGARLAGTSRRESWAIGFGMNSRGVMEIILGVLALQYGIIGESLFVALVVMALVTSIMSGPVMQRILQRRRARRFADYLSARGLINPLQATERNAAIEELSRAASAVCGLKPSIIAAAVMERERMMATGMGNELAVPHARLFELATPVVCIGISRNGVNFESRDQTPARLIFLLLTPRQDDGTQLELLADIASTFQDPAVRSQAIAVQSFTQFIAVVRTERPQHRDLAPMHRE